MNKLRHSKIFVICMYILFVLRTLLDASMIHLCRSGGGDVISTSTNDACGKVVGGEREEGYEMVEISHREPPPPAKLEEKYEVPLSPAHPSQPLPTIPPTAGAEENTALYDVIPGDQ